MIWLALPALLVLLAAILSWPGSHQPCRVCGKTNGIRKVADLCPKHGGGIQ